MTPKEKQEEKKARLKSSLITVGFYAALLLIFVFAGFRTSLPLPAEEMDLILGEDMLGMENISEEDISASEQEVVEEQPVEEVVEEVEPVETEEEVITQDAEDAPVVESKTDEVKKEITEQEVTEEVKEPVKPVRKPNQNFMFNKSEKAGKGDDKVEGNKGGENGSPDATNMGKGGGNGDFSFDMTGRGLLKKPPKIQADPGNPQRVVIAITVNGEGKVIDAKVNPKGSTILIGPLVNKAIEAAKKTEWTSKAVELQKGTITFNFIN